VDSLARQQPVLIFHAIVADRSPALESIARAHGGDVVQMSVEGNALFGKAKPTLLDLRKP
jgi:ribosomal protein S7